MLNEVALECDVVVPTKDLNGNVPIRLRSIVATRLLKNLVYVKSAEKHGYYLTVTKLKFTGKGKRHEKYLNFILFPVIFTCRTFRPCVGETMLGVVHMIHERGVVLKCGPMKWIFLSRLKMAGYQNFVPGKKAAFLNDSLSRIEVDKVIRFKVLAVKWVNDLKVSREFQVLASLEGDSLGPVSPSDSDDMDLL